jgi:hypothetical protein
MEIPRRKAIEWLQEICREQKSSGDLDTLLADYAR